MNDAALSARAALFTPASRLDRVHKALGSGAEAVITDLEDAVAATDKGSARNALHTLLTADDLPNRDRLIVRINPPINPNGRADLEMLANLEAQQRPALMVPKAEATGVFNQLPEALESVPVIALVETPVGVRDVYRTAALKQVDRLAFGAIDLSVALGCRVQAAPIEAARAAVVTASAAAGLVPPLDTPSIDLINADVMRAGADASVRDGFGGTLCIHPRQIGHVLEAFTPSAEVVAWAERVVALDEGVGAIDGEMVDRPVLLRAERILSDAGGGRELSERSEVDIRGESPT